MINQSVKFNVNHLDVMDIKPEYKDIVLNLAEVRYALSNIPGGASGDAATILIDGRIVLCLGYMQLSPGIVEVWLIPSIYMEKHAVSIIQDVKAYLNSFAEKFQWYRIQTVTQNNDQHRKWMRVLGFTEGEPLKNYLGGKDYITSVMCFER